METEPAQAPYSNSMETPLEEAARTEGAAQGAGAKTRREEREADVLVADIDAYVAQTDPASLPEAEKQLEAWQIPGDPLEGVPDNVLLDPGAAEVPLVSVFSAQTESEANIVRGLLESSGIPAFLDGVAGPALGSIFQSDETRWGDILVPSHLAGAAGTVIADATHSAAQDGEFTG